MAEMRLYAIRIDDVRDMFSANESLAARLRELALAAFPTPAPRKFGRLAQLGPLFRRPVEAYGVSPTVPNHADVDLLLTGQFIPPERVIAAWKIVEWWLSCEASRSWRMEVTETAINDLDFDLSLLGVPAAYGLRKAFRGALGVPLQPFPGLTVGYAKHDWLVGLLATWTPIIGSLSGKSQELAESLRAAHADLVDHPDRPDLVALYS